ncbi:nicotinate (nicotinamide) nucleotide adenylyltransferase [Desulfomarina sp.]
MKIRVGVLGGTFNPVHFGHLELAETAILEYSLDRVIFIPSKAPPHKAESGLVSFSHRCKMMEIACGDYPLFRYDCIEGELPAPSYTIDTLRTLKKRIGEDCTLFFIIGSDAFLDILTWKSFRHVLREVSLIVGHRKDVDSRKMVDLALNIGYDRKKKSHWSSDWGGKDILFLDTSPVGVSSTFIRNINGNFRELEKYVPLKVVEYIRDKRLYQHGG